MYQNPKMSIRSSQEVLKIQALEIFTFFCNNLIIRKGSLSHFKSQYLFCKNVSLPKNDPKKLISSFANTNSFNINKIAVLSITNLTHLQKTIFIKLEIIVWAHLKESNYEHKKYYEFLSYCFLTQKIIVRSS